jgi:hypothetical protein
MLRYVPVGTVLMSRFALKRHVESSLGLTNP